MAMPSLFLSHGAPTLILEDTPARRFIAGLASELPRPRAIVVASAHWTTTFPAVTGAPRPGTLHDFYGFPESLYAVRYPAPGAPALAEDILGRLRAAGLTALVDNGRGFDHGVWQPLCLAWPEADIPVVQLSLQPAAGPAHHLAVGEALAGLRGEGVLVLGSGAITHNLGEFGLHGRDAPTVDYAAAFADWVGDRLSAGDVDALLDYRARGPEGWRNHPTEEHFLPLFVAMGAASPHWRSQRLHESSAYGVLRMDAWAFRPA